MNKDFIDPKSIISIKGKGRLSAECTVTARVTTTFHFDDDESTVMRLNITATASNLDMFLTYCDRDENADIEVEILDIFQPDIRSHEDNLQWLDHLENRERSDDFAESLRELERLHKEPSAPDATDAEAKREGADQ